MVQELHKRSVHVDAPVDKVFAYVEDPHHFFEAFDEEWRRHMALVEVKTTPDGVGSTYRMMGRMFLLFHMEWVLTREEYVRNERIVDHANTGGVWTSTFEPDATGTTVTMAFGWSSNIPFMGEFMDRVGWNGDSDLDLMLANLKEAIEA
jgi:polyketide cyclase/dehydrase/lipid transport protein